MAPRVAATAVVAARLGAGGFWGLVILRGPALTHVSPL